MSESVKLKLTVTVYPEGRTPFSFKTHGRNGWMVLQLLRAGAAGVSTLDRPAIRMSQYTLLLRRHGLTIETVFEKHGGPFAGEHGRYHLLDKVTVEGGTLDAYLDSPEGRREFPGFRDIMAERRAA